MADAARLMAYRVGDPLLHHLVAADGAAAHLPLAGVGDGEVATGAGEPGETRRHREPPVFERVEGDPQALALGAEAMFHRHREIVEEHRIGAQRPGQAAHADAVGAETGMALRFDDEGGDPVAGRVGHAGDENARVRGMGEGDEHLGAVEAVDPALAAGGGADAAPGIGAAARFGQR